MEIRILESDFCSNCYMINNKDEVYIIDPSVSVQVIKKHLKENEKVKAVLFTHSHIDHIFYASEYLKEFSCKLYFHKNGLEILKDPYKNCSKMFGLNIIFRFNDEDYQLIDDSYIIDDFIKCIYTPGHSADSLCFIVEDIIFTGDTLFKMSIGRCDLYSGDYKIMNESLKKLYNIKGNYKIYPGHGADSTLEYEWNNNFYVINALK